MHAATRCLVGWLCLPHLALASSTLRQEDGTIPTWPVNTARGAPYVPLGGYAPNTSGIYAEELEAAVVHGMRQWEAATGDRIDWDYWSGEDPEVFTPNSYQNGVSMIYFASTDPLIAPFLRGAVARTQLWLGPHGQIVEADVVLNDLEYAFVTDPALTTYTESGPLYGRVVMLEDVVVHELGHVLGLGHSGVHGSTMFTWAWPSQAELSCEDVSAARSLYAGDVGRIEGRIIDEEGAAVFGAEVAAISVSRGLPMGGALSDVDGHYRIEGLPPGSYALVVQPSYAGAANLSPYYNHLSDLCPGQPFSRSFVEGEEGLAWAVRREASTDAGEAVVRCAAGADVAPMQGTRQHATAPLLAAGSVKGLVAVDAPPVNQPSWYRIEHEGGPLALDLLSASLFSPIWPRVELRDRAGEELPIHIEEPAISDPATGYEVWDVRVQAELERGVYFLVVEPYLLAPEIFPGGDLYLDARPFVLFLGIDPADRRRCTVPRDPTPYLPPSGGPSPTPELAEPGCLFRSVTWLWLLPVGWFGHRRRSALPAE